MDPAIDQAIKSIGFDMVLDDFTSGLEDELFLVNSEYRVRFANSAIQHNFPEGTESPIDRYCYEVFEGRDKPCGSPLWECPLNKVLQDGSLTTLIHPYGNKYIKITMWPLKNNYGNIVAVVELRRDVTAERELEKQILKRHHHLDALRRISFAVSGLQDLDAILNVAFDNVLQIYNGNVGGVLLFDEKVQKLCYKVHRGLSA